MSRSDLLDVCRAFRSLIYKNPGSEAVAFLNPTLSFCMGKGLGEQARCSASTARTRCGSRKARIGRPAIRSMDTEDDGPRARRQCMRRARWRRLLPQVSLARQNICSEVRPRLWVAGFHLSIEPQYPVQTDMLVGPNAIRPDRLAPEERLEEFAEIPASGLPTSPRSRIDGGPPRLTEHCSRVACELPSARAETRYPLRYREEARL